MRGKLAKALRRQARAVTEGAPAKAYLSRQHERTIEVPVRDKHGRLVPESAALGSKTVMQRVKVSSYEMRLDVNFTHGAYKALKRQLRRE